MYNVKMANCITSRWRTAQYKDGEMYNVKMAKCTTSSSLNELEITILDYCTRILYKNTILEGKA